jgi:ornithine carbamoyltransferase
MTRHFLALHDYSKSELDTLLAFAAKLKKQQQARHPHPLLAGKTLAMIFEKSSTRTRLSFEIGIFQLGGYGLFIAPGSSQMGRGEPICDTARVLSRYCDGVMIRTFGQEIVKEFARFSTIPVINGLTDLFHPCQILADLQTIIERKGSYENLVHAWVGDGNNMANTWIEAATILGFELRLACPQGYEPDAGVLLWAKERGGRILLTTDPQVAVAGADVINTDVWASMGQEDEQKAREIAFAGYCVDAALLGHAHPDAIVLHCLPAHRGEEISNDVIEGPQSVVWDEAENRLHIQKAIMARLMA